MTLLPGDILLTGTPEGVGYARTPPEYLSPGDEVTVTVTGIGRSRTGSSNDPHPPSRQHVGVESTLPRPDSVPSIGRIKRAQP